MALTSFGQAVCRVIAANRRSGGEADGAGAAAPNEALAAPRVSKDIDLIHDSCEAVEYSWERDRAALDAHGLCVEVVRQRPAYVVAQVSQGADAVLLEWTADSAFCFFPLVPHPVFGVTLHPLDLATNKVLALAGRHEARDWIDALQAAIHLQPLGYLAWAAAGKDPGFSPQAIVEQAARNGRYTQAEVDALRFEGPRPDVANCAQQWRAQVEEARAIVDALPAAHAGTAVLTPDAKPCRGRPTQLAAASSNAQLLFHAGAIRGALPTLRDA